MLIEALATLMRKLHYFGIFSDKMAESNFTVVKEKGSRPFLHLKNVETFSIKKDITASVRKQLRHSSYNVTLLFVNSFSDVRVFNEEQMRKNGWQRI